MKIIKTGGYLVVTFNQRLHIVTIDGVNSTIEFATANNLKYNSRNATISLNQSAGDIVGKALAWCGKGAPQIIILNVKEVN